MPTDAYRIKPLDWRIVRQDEMCPEWWEAATVFGAIHVERETDGTCFWRYCFDEHYDEGRHDCASVEVGKAEAEQFYLGRLMPALEAQQ